MRSKVDFIEEILSIAKKYDLHIFSIMATKGGNVGILDTIKDHRIYEYIFRQLFDEFHAITYPNGPTTTDINVDDTKVPVEFLMGCMKATLNHLDQLSVNSDKEKYTEFLKGNIEGLSNDEIDNFIDRKLNEGIVPIKYIEFNDSDDPNTGNVHLACTFLPVLTDICDYLSPNKFCIVPLEDGWKDLTLPNNITFDKIKSFLKSNIKYTPFKLEKINMNKVDSINER